jgi:hypothetical protein
MAVQRKLGFRAQPMVNANSVFLRLFQDANHLSVQSSVNEAFVRSKLCYRLAEACDSIGGFADCGSLATIPFGLTIEALSSSFAACDRGNRTYIITTRRMKVMFASLSLG